MCTLHQPKIARQLPDDHETGEGLIRKLLRRE
jgi:hypothetical protein